MKIKEKFALACFLDPHTNTYEFAKSKLNSSKKKKKAFFSLFVFIGIITLISTFILSFLSTMKLAGLWIFNISDENDTQWQNNLINNYVYTTSIISSIVSFFGSISSFLTFKEGYVKNKIIYKKINFELVQFENQIGYYFGKNSSEANDILLDHTYKILNFSNPFKNKKLKEGEKNE